MVIATQNRKIRLCIDCFALNKILLQRQFLLKTSEEVTVNVGKSKYFTKLDFKKGLWQLKVSPCIQLFLTFSTPWRKYSFLRIQFGIKSTLKLFQKVIAKILQGIPNVENSVDDILI